MRVQPWHQTPWDWRAAIQFICGGTGTGLLFFTALASLSEPAWLLRTGLLALAFVGLGLFFVWIKLGRRLRALFVFMNPRTSWMTREAIFSILLIGSGVVGIWFRSGILGLVAAVFGLGYLYSQARILKESMGIPAWREPLIVPLMVMTGLVEGASLFLTANVIYGSNPMWISGTLFLLVAVRFWVWVMYRQKLSAIGASPIRTVETLDQTNQVLTPLGHVAPLILLLIGIIIPSTIAVSGLLSGLTALAGGWYLKFNLMTRVAYNQGFALEHTPARTPGYGGPGSKPGWSVPADELKPSPQIEGIAAPSPKKAIPER